MQNKMALIDVLVYIKDIFLLWLSIFIAPLRNLNMLWILLPVIINWGFTEFYQEKKGTSMGNAITNGVVALLVGIDWLRTATGELTDKNISLSVYGTYFIISLLMVIYGLFIMVSGIMLKKRVKYIGRITEVTYFTLMFTPVIYGIVQIGFNVLIAIIVFFPVFYFVVQFFDFIIPDPKTYEQEDRENQYKNKLFTDIDKQPPMFQGDSNYRF